MEVDARLQPLKDSLRTLTEQYTKAVEAVLAVGQQPYTDFMARRLVEMAGNIVMGYLMLLDAQRNADFDRTATIYNKMAQAEVARHARFIDNFNADQLELYKA